MSHCLKYRILPGIIFLVLIISPLGSQAPVQSVAQPALIIDNFENSPGPLANPAWNMRHAWKFDEVQRYIGQQVYSIGSEPGNRFLHASTEGHPEISVLLVRLVNSHKIVKGETVRWNLGTHPYLSWRWRAHRLPAFGNETDKRFFDNACAIFIIFVRYDLPLLPWNWQPIDVLQYTWSTTLPQGFQFKKKAKKFGFNLYEGQFIVLESGASKAGIWVKEKRNILQDYRERFGSYPSANPILIALITDSDRTRTVSIADYDDFMLESQ